GDWGREVICQAEYVTCSRGVGDYGRTCTCRKRSWHRSWLVHGLPCYQRAHVGDEIVGHARAAQKGLGNLALRTVDRIWADGKGPRCVTVSRSLDCAQVGVPKRSVSDVSLIKTRIA